MSRVLVLVPFALDDKGLANREAQLSEAGVRSDVSYDFRPVKAGPASFQSPHDWMLLDVAILEAGLGAESDGYDGVVVDTASDSGVDALRSVLEIPVIGAGQTSLLFALTLGRSFGVLAQWEPALARMRKSLSDWNLAGHCAGVEHFDTEPDFAGLIGDKRDEVLPRMEAACLRLIDRGADVVVLGSTTMHQAHGYLRERLPVPIVNPGPLSYKLMEELLSAGLSHSRAAYPGPLVPKEEMIHAMLDAAAAES